MPDPTHKRPVPNPSPPPHEQLHTSEEALRRKNIKTALIILAFIAIWLLIGFHQAYCNA